MARWCISGIWRWKRWVVTRGAREGWCRVIDVIEETSREAESFELGSGDEGEVGVEALSGELSFEPFEPFEPFELGRA